MDEIYDVVIIGSGPAGLTAGLYTSRAKFRTIIIEKETLGGELMDRDMIENYPGYPDGILGPELGSNIVRQVKNHGAKINFGEVEKVMVEKDYKRVITADGGYLSKAIIIASGAHPKKLGVAGEQEFLDKGVFYCATCDGPGFANKVVVVAGGGDSGITEALLLANYVSKVYVIEMLPYFTANKTLQERAFSNAKIETMCGIKIEAVRGIEQVQAVDLLNLKTGQKNTLPVDGILVHVGIEPNIDFIKDILSLNGKGQIIVNENLETEIADIFAVGDVRNNSPMQISTAVGDGATAALSLERRMLRGY
jgi:thioredoxin reductase (NADPH)